MSTCEEHNNGEKIVVDTQKSIEELVELVQDLLFQNKKLAEDNKRLRMGRVSKSDVKNIVKGLSSENACA